jgi:hypothetical protein
MGLRHADALWSMLNEKAKAQHLDAPLEIAFIGAKSLMGT